MYKVEIEKLQQTRSTDSSEVKKQYELERMKTLNSRVYNKINEKQMNEDFEISDGR